MRFPRASGVLLHPTSLPGRFGIGDLGPEAYRFVDFLADAGQKVWQVLPLGPTGYGDSPYQCFSAFAGNPLLISLDRLREQSYLTEEDLRDSPQLPDHEVDFGRVIPFRRAKLQRAFERFLERAVTAEHEAFQDFCQAQVLWLWDYALFAAAKDAHGGREWTAWEGGLAHRSPTDLPHWHGNLAREVAAHQYWQFEFFRQWHALKQYANKRGIRIMGDIPIYLAHDSADVWMHPGLFMLDGDGRPAAVAGVPPDYFSQTGQLWGNPLYCWEVMAATGYRWWIDRFRAAFTLCDVVRIDHFRGFESYWEVPLPAENAVHGRWLKGPGAALFDAVRQALGDPPIVAENLGMITPEVEKLRAALGFPGMSILQFAFGAGEEGKLFRPHNYERNLVAYTGSHDNDTMVGWCGSQPESRQRAERYLGVSGNDLPWASIRALLASVADTVLFPLQDLLGLGNEARMNLPARPDGNWRWRFNWNQFPEGLAGRLRELTELYER